MPGHKDIEGNKLVYKQTKEAACEMSGTDSKDFPIIMDKKEAVAEITNDLKIKWKRKYELSEKLGQSQEVFTEVACRNDRQIFSAVNQLLTGHSFLNNHKAKLDPSVSKLRSACHVPVSPSCAVPVMFQCLQVMQCLSCSSVSKLCGACHVPVSPSYAVPVMFQCLQVMQCLSCSSVSKLRSACHVPVSPSYAVPVMFQKTLTIIYSVPKETQHLDIF